VAAWVQDFHQPFTSSSHLEGIHAGIVWRLLIIQADSEERLLIERDLRQAGHSVTIASQGRQGIDLAQRLRPDLILLDLSLPDLSGTEVCRALKRHDRTTGIGIVILSDKDTEVDRVIGFELGADDYLVKPISRRELLLRIEAILRRTRPVPEERFIEEFGRLRIDREAHRVWVDEHEATLTALEFKLLLALYGRRGRTRSRAALLREVWQTEPDSPTRTVDQHVKRLRERLGPAGAYIETVRREGYRFVATPDGSDAPGSPDS
jgi:two-component system phosphate regulon response regulator PhoB